MDFLAPAGSHPAWSVAAPHRVQAGTDFLNIAFESAVRAAFQGLQGRGPLILLASAS